MSNRPSKTGLFKGRHFEQEIIILCVLVPALQAFYRDLVEMMAERSLPISHTTILRWVRHYAPEFDKRWSRFSAQMRAVRVARRAVSADLAPVKYFPRDRIWDLFESGFVVAANRSSPNLYERLNIRDAMITVLMHGGGLRESEPFHLYVTDVAVDPHSPKNALVRLFHPEQGAAPADFIDPLTKKLVSADREQYLRVKWQMEPRNLVPGRFHAGWKDLHLTDERLKYALVHWFPSYWGEVFLALFKLYIIKVRSRHSHHPFLFVSQKDGVAGEPYTIAYYRVRSFNYPLAFGFWSSLFNVHFQNVLWKDLRLVFPRCPKPQRQRHTISSALNQVRDLRNRIFHHEQLLWLNPSLVNLHAKGIEVVGWLNPQLPPWLYQYDRLLATWVAVQPI